MSHDYVNAPFSKQLRYQLHTVYICMYTRSVEYIISAYQLQL